MTSIIQVMPRSRDISDIKIWKEVYVHAEPKKLEKGDFVYILHGGSFLGRFSVKDIQRREIRPTPDAGDIGTGWVISVRDFEPVPFGGLERLRPEWKHPRGFMYIEGGELWGGDVERRASATGTPARESDSNGPRAGQTGVQRTPPGPTEVRERPGGEIWSRIELMLALELFERGDVRPDEADPAVRDLAAEIGRTPASVALKLANFKSVSTGGARGMPHSGKGDEEIWEDFHSRPNSLREAIDREYARLAREAPSGEAGRRQSTNAVKSLIKKGNFAVPDDVAPQKRRRHQAALREVVLEDYSEQCALCSVSLRDLLLASHIKPWSVDEKNRLNPRNVIALCAIHDRAFDLGLIAIRADGTVILTPRVETLDEPTRLLLLGAGRIRQPREYPPDEEFLAWHRRRFGAS